MATKIYPDISHYHTVSDWSKVKANCPFLISKATEGTSLIDSTLDSFIKGCEDNGIPYWLYTFLRAGNELAQAKYCVSTCKDKVGSHFMGYVLDVEKGNTAANVKSALDYITGLGYKSMIYTMYAEYDTYKSVISGRPSDCAWWEARYGKNTGSYNSQYPCHTGADLHQYTSEGSCSGITGNCDLSRLTGTKEEEWFTTPASGAVSANSASTTTKADASGSTLTVDGVIGANTVKRLQKVLGTTADGKIDGQNSKYKAYWASISSAVCSWSGGKSAVVKAMQKKVGVTQDGLLGEKTAKALQNFLIKAGYSCGSTGADGKFGTNSAKALQKWLNAQ